MALPNLRIERGQAGRSYTGAADEDQARLWRLARNGPRGARWEPLAAPPGVIAWGHGHANSLIAAALAALIAAGAWFTGGQRFDPGVWPLWLFAALALAVVPLNLAFRERFELDARARRWRYQRGWLGNLQVEGGGYETLTGLVLQRIHASSVDRELDFHVVVLEFADGLRFRDLSPRIYPVEAARAEAARIAQASGLPLVGRVDGDLGRD
jgi:hypothetical protein